MTDVPGSFDRQAEACARLGSPFMARLMRLLAQAITEEGAGDAGPQNGYDVSSLRQDILNWPGDPEAHADALGLRLAGALHNLVLSGEQPELAACYPPHDVPDPELAAVIARAMALNATAIRDFIRSPPQTNEVRRAAALAPGFLSIAATTGLPLTLSELGASGGLNLAWDRFGIQLGSVHIGPQDSPVQLSPDWRGSTLPACAVRIAGRAGCDLRPLDRRKEAHRTLLLSYLWPDQAERLARTRAAIDLASTLDIDVAAADAADWLGSRLAEPHTGTAHVIYHSIAWQYFPDSVQMRCRAQIDKAGARATVEAPLALLSMEGRPDAGKASLSLQMWPGAGPQVVGHTGFHGQWVEWTGYRS